MNAGTFQIRQVLARVKNHDNGRTRLTFHEPKTTHSRRTLPIPEYCLTAIKRHRARQAENKLLMGEAYDDMDLVFCQTNGKPIDPRNFNRYFTGILNEANLPHIRLHDSRHTYATLLLEHGVSPKVVQALLGHSSVAITLDIYSHVSLELEQQAAAKLNDALSDGLA